MARHQHRRRRPQQRRSNVLRGEGQAPPKPRRHQNLRLHLRRAVDPKAIGDEVHDGTPGLQVESLAQCQQGGINDPQVPRVPCDDGRDLVDGLRGVHLCKELLRVALREEPLKTRPCLGRRTVWTRGIQAAQEVHREVVQTTRAIGFGARQARSIVPIEPLATTQALRGHSPDALGHEEGRRRPHHIPGHGDEAQDLPQHRRPCLAAGEVGHGREAGPSIHVAAIGPRDRGHHGRLDARNDRPPCPRQLREAAVCERRECRRPMNDHSDLRLFLHLPQWQRVRRHAEGQRREEYCAHRPPRRAPHRLQLPRLRHRAAEAAAPSAL
mmetsp:Transcript_66620/g.192402  ORF Transcript_66620/g.192402 Transcript_66620/m.192402 type:complete len:325 (-) Transcript_66620:60-1034(-)